MRKTARKNSPGKSRHKQEDNTRIYFIEIKVNLRNWIVWISIGIIGKCLTTLELLRDPVLHLIQFLELS